MKRCTRCERLKPLGGFPRAKRAKDGRGSRCNACMSEILAAYRAGPEGRQARKETQQRYQESPKGRAKRSAYARTDKARAQRRAYAQTAKGKEVMKQSRAKYMKRLLATHEGQLKAQARMAVCHAVEAGKIPPVSSLSCEGCGQPAEHYHHDLGYKRSYWFHIVPLCHICHHRIHYPESDSPRATAVPQ